MGLNRTPIGEKQSYQRPYVMTRSISIPEITSILKTDPGDLSGVIAKRNLQPLISNDRITYEHLPSILDVYKKEHDLHNREWTIPEWLLSMSDEWPRTLVAMYREPVSFPASLPPSQGKIIHDLILKCAPTNVVEIGCFIGVSSVWIGSALKELGRGHLYSVDLFESKFPAPPFHWGFLENPLDFAIDKIKMAGLDGYVEFVQMNSGKFAKRLKASGADQIDFLFIDGDHSIAGCLDDFVNYYPFVKEGGKILLHDIYPENCDWPGPRYLLDRVIGDSPCFEVREIETKPNFGMALITKLKDDKRFYPRGSAGIEFSRHMHRARRRLREAFDSLKR